MDIRRAALLLLAVLLVSCGGQGSVATTSPTPQRSPAVWPSPIEQLGPGGLTLDEEVGAVIMVGFQGALTDAVLSDWSGHQFGGLLLVNANRNAGSPASLRALIA